MKLVVRRLAWLLPLALCACSHNPPSSQMQALAPPLDDTPPPPDISPTALPAPVYNIPKVPVPVAAPPEPVKATPKHHHSSTKGPVNAAANGATGQQPGQVAEAPAAEVPAGGKFETPQAPDLKKQTENSIADIERGLNGIGRKLTDQEEKTSVQIREFLKQARTALSSGDVAGAQGLADKAKTMLGELNE